MPAEVRGHVVVHRADIAATLRGIDRCPGSWVGPRGSTSTAGVGGASISPGVGATYWPHRANFDRISRTGLDWRILCPGPMVEKGALGLGRIRTSLDRVPVPDPALTQALPGALLLPIFVQRIPEMIVPYAEAAALILANLSPSGAMSLHRVGSALPVGMRGRKAQWAARPKLAKPRHRDGIATGRA
jgi:hypothetical protein